MANVIGYRIDVAMPGKDSKVSLIKYMTMNVIISLKKEPTIF
jgi:hypothetical protein